ncbi:Col_cuticle_N domain-containing protein [Meloidogyne graminicola]|uniref:Col_cuticle_N domain-containing protein n=1 Tax=Meloidogyne graminicola TaxID=189291 RepID=A0A8S9ZR30_9BILA|nr:Col_cuticle_N domain-containing protein [Meloidogyne graminicola]
MQETKVLLGIACFSSFLAVFAVLIVIPQLYLQINEINIKVRDGVQVFRVNTDSAWNKLMEIQLDSTPPSKAENFQSIFRIKRQLPAYCICQPIQINFPQRPMESKGHPDRQEGLALTEFLEKWCRPTWTSRTERNTWISRQTWWYWITWNSWNEWNYSVIILNLFSIFKIFQ